jgi:hypothetical protein
MRSPRPFAALLLPALLLAIPPAAHARDLLSRAAPASGRAAALAARPRTEELAVDREALEQLRASGTATIALPLADGSTLALDLESLERFDPGARVTDNDD